MRRGVKVAAPWAILAQLAQHLSLLDLITVVDSALQIGDCNPSDIEESLRPGTMGRVPAAPCAGVRLGCHIVRTRLRRWRAEVARSTLSGSGRRALARRLARYDRR
jgi:hypothetical protein